MPRTWGVPNKYDSLLLFLQTDPPTFFFFFGFQRRHNKAPELCITKVFTWHQTSFLAACTLGILSLRVWLVYLQSCHFSFIPKDTSDRGSTSRVVLCGTARFAHTVFQFSEWVVNIYNLGDSCFLQKQIFRFLRKIKRLAPGGWQLHTPGLSWEVAAPLRRAQGHEFTCPTTPSPGGPRSAPIFLLSSSSVLCFHLWCHLASAGIGLAPAGLDFPGILENQISLQGYTSGSNPSIHTASGHLSTLANKSGDWASSTDKGWPLHWAEHILGERPPPIKLTP